MGRIAVSVRPQGAIKKDLVSLRMARHVKPAGGHGDDGKDWRPVQR
jgi:hypothetical protein